jgi:hypothetical protein
MMRVDEVALVEKDYVCARELVGVNGRAPLVNPWRHFVGVEHLAGSDRMRVNARDSQREHTRKPTSTQEKAGGNTREKPVGTNTRGDHEETIW